jgi:hypothetical protein
MVIGVRSSAYAALPPRRRKPYLDVFAPFTRLFLGPPEPHILKVMGMQSAVTV